MRRHLKYIALGGAIAAVLDIAYAFAFYGAMGVSPLRILQSIASGLLGRQAYAGGLETASLGAVLHLLIAIVAASVFYVASLRFRWLVQHAVAAGIAFGVCVYGVMNFVVLPLSAFPQRGSPSPFVIVTGLLAHILLVGLPIALCTRTALRRLT